MGIHVNAQDKGGIEIIQDARINKLVEKHIQLNRLQQGNVMDGYRVQIFFDSGNESKKRAMESRTEFMGNHPDIPAYLSFQEPYYKVRVGDFRNKVEADGLLKKISSTYPNAFTVKDKINFPEIR